MKMPLGLALLGSVSALALAVVAPANAADLAVKAPPVPVFSWTGCYVGAHAGWGWGNKEFNGSTSFYYSKFSTDGALAGGQLGCNYQIPASNWVIGIEGSGSGADINGSGVTTWPTVTSAKTTALGSVTGRIGWNGWNPQNLFYVKGGWAWANNSYLVTSQFDCCGPSTASQNRSGWTVGGGWEWAFTQNWSAFAEYDHYDFGTSTATFTELPSSGIYLVPIRQTIKSVKVGVNYRFY